MTKVLINKFGGGIVNDPRTPVGGFARWISNFDTLTDSHRLIPHRTAEDGDESGSTNKIQNFCIGLEPTETATYAVYGLGVQSGAADAKIFYKKIATDGGNPDLSTDTWTAANDGEQDVGTTAQFDLFMFYKKTNKIYYARDKRHICSYDTVNETMLETEEDLGATFTNIGQGIVHSKDDIMYFPVDNVVWKNNNDTFASALTLPTNVRIRTIEESGNFLAIGVEAISGASPGVGASYIYLWDRNATLATVSDSVYWGEERLLFMGEVNGNLVGVSIGAGTSWFDRRIVFRYLSGSRAIKFEEFTTNADIGISQLNTSQQLINNRLFFNITFTVNGTVRSGVWSVGGFPNDWSIVNERPLDNDTEFSLTTLNTFGFLIIGDYVFQAYDIGGSGHTITKTADGTTYTAKSIYESIVNPEMLIKDRFRKKQLKSVRVSYEPLPVAGQVILKYKVDGGSYITIFTETTDSALNTERVKDATPDEFTLGTEYEFELESTGGAVITALEYDYDTLETLI